MVQRAQYVVLPRCGEKYRAVLACHHLLHPVEPRRQNSHLEYPQTTCLEAVHEGARFVVAQLACLTLPTLDVIQLLHFAPGQ